MAPNPHDYPNYTSDARYRDDVYRHNQEQEQSRQNEAYQREQDARRRRDDDWGRKENQRKQEERRREETQRRQNNDERRKKKASRDKENRKRRAKIFGKPSKQNKGKKDIDVLGAIFGFFASIVSALVVGIFEFIFSILKFFIGLAILGFVALVAFYAGSEPYNDSVSPEYIETPPLTPEDIQINNQTSDARIASAPESGTLNLPSGDIQLNNQFSDDRIASVPELDQLAANIGSRIEDGSVDFIGVQGPVSGYVTRTWINQKNGSNPKNKGIAAEILWDDGVDSTILFRSDNVVRVWDDDVESKGQWFLDSSVLRVHMNEGGRYAFSSN